MKKLLWDLRGRYNWYKLLTTKDFDPQSNVKLVQKNAMHCFEA